MALNRSKLVVVAMVGISVVALGMLRLTYFSEEGEQGKLAEIPCDALLSTYIEIQGKRLPVSRDTLCALLPELARMVPTGDEYRHRDDDPWHYYGRMPIFQSNDVWFLVFIARRSSGFKLLYSLHHRKGGGWTIIGQFEAEPLLRRLGVWGRIDRELLQSPQSLTPTDENAP